MKRIIVSICALTALLGIAAWAEPAKSDTSPLSLAAAPSKASDKSALHIADKSDEFALHIAGELNLRYRYSLDRDVVKDENFQFYEIELFLDAAANDYTSIFVEYPISHKNYLNPGNAWVDFHMPGELAASEYTGLMIGNFSPRFAYLNYDDNQSWIYGGRATVNSALVRSARIDGQAIRDRQVGISAPLKLGPLLVEPGIQNGSGPVEFSGGQDNDRKFDWSGRIQYTLPDELGLVGAGIRYSPKTEGATNNTEGTRWAGSGAKHVRDITRYAVYFKYPNVSQTTLPDLSLGGKPFVLFGEYYWMNHEGNPNTPQWSKTLNAGGGYLEANFNIVRDKLVGVVRYDYLDVDKDKDANTLMGVTAGVKYAALRNLWLNAFYESYFGDKNAAGRNDDRIAVELAVWF